MAIFDRVPDNVLRTEFQHVGWFCGICPVYVADLDTGTPFLIERNWVPEWWFGLTEVLFAMYCKMATFYDPWFEPGFPILITGEIVSD